MMYAAGRSDGRAEETPVAKLTLELDEADTRLAAELANAEGLSVSGLVSKLLRRRATTRQRKAEREKLPPMTRKLSGIIRNPEKKSDRELIEDAILERHGFKK